ncbi:MAG TPA: prepilin-type N-terminal cleavage/methylation domain-containing protein [Thermodesulfovibrionales bacterium]|nr:prepilin-type N-terminal cleavage/methylation domain-containing protein [Thermodesulfovibrionales bacterium]
MKNERGVTLAELVVVIAVIGTLIMALAFSFNKWRASYHAESQTKEMYADLMHARIKAVHQNRLHFVVVGQHHYQIYEDTDESGGNAPSAGDVAWWPSPKPFKYPSFWSGTVAMHTNGIVSTNIGYFGATVRFDLDLDGDGVPDISPDYDCVVLFSTRINIGAWQAGKCVAT